MDFSIQPILESHKVRLVPLQESDFERLYQVASDPLVWEQHPNKNRFEREVFKIFMLCRIGKIFKVLSDLSCV